MLALIRPLLARFLPGLGSPYLLVGIAVAAFGVGGWAGGWAIYKIVKDGEVRALESAITDQQAFYQSTIKINADKAAKKLQRASERTTVHKVIRNVKDDVVCDLPPVVAGVLDLRIKGEPVGAIGGTAPSARLEGISQSQSLNALDRAAEEYYGCRDELIAANLKYEGCEVICK